VRISHRLATAILIGDLGGLRHDAGWPSAGLRGRLRASAIDGVVVGDRADPRARVVQGGRRLTVAV